MTERDVSAKLMHLGLEALRLAEGLAPGAEGFMAGAAPLGMDLQKSDDSDYAIMQARRPVAQPSLPDAALVRQIIVAREGRREFFPEAQFADPAWDMILDLMVARVEGQRISVTSLCTASRVPLTTALRWITQLVDAGIFKRTEDDLDRRRAFISLSDKGAKAAASYFAKYHFA